MLMRLTVTVLWACTCGLSFGQARDPLWSFDKAAGEEYLGVERKLIDLASADSLRSLHDMLASEPHIAGTPGDERVIASIRDWFEDLGLETRVHEFWAYLPSPIDAAVEVGVRAGDGSFAFTAAGLKESELPVDPYSRLEGLTIGWNAYSGSGDVTAEVVYANHGRKEDFEELARLGISCEGRVVIARYGGNYRGFKAKYAEEAGAAALIIYTDPKDTAPGPSYPEGGYHDPTCIQRGSIVTMGYNGDPLTPFVEATEDASRLDPKSVALPRIPVQPVGWNVAEMILSKMAGGEAPESWRGSLPLEYRLTGGTDLRVRVMVRQERAIRKSSNVIATLKGKADRGEFVVIGAHHDAWNCGAADPTCGTICVLESARNFAELARGGWRPERSILFCAWGAEEFGIIGSSEWVEGNRERLERDAIAYINLDMAVTGPNFGSAASPSLRRAIESAAALVPQARQDGVTVLGAWAKGAAPTFGDVGGGSDHVGFLGHAGVPSCALTAGGGPGNSYHTNYDTLAWYRKVNGDDYEPNQMVTRMTSLVAARMACEPVIPLDIGADLRRSADQLDAIAGRMQGEQIERARALASRFRELSDSFDRELLRCRQIGQGPFLSDSLAAIVNGVQMASKRAWLWDEGLSARPWFRNMLSSPDEFSGYASWVLPELESSLASGEAERISRALSIYSSICDRFSAILVEIEAIRVPTDPAPKP